MNTLEDRLRAALQTGAEDFSAHPDAWQQILARSREARRRRGVLRWPGTNGYISPLPASGAPALGGMTLPFAKAAHTRKGQNPPLEWKAFGYAHADVTMVVLQLPGGKHLSAPTFAAWPGSGLRLWAVTLPSDIGWGGRGVPQPTATAYDAAGQAVAQVTLGTSG
jgi:hypothetical protein